MNDTDNDKIIPEEEKAASAAAPAETGTDTPAEETEEAKEPLSDSEVTSHTASMWKYNPVPDAPEPYPEYKADYSKKYGFEIAAARVRGKKHKHEGSNCDDWYAYDFFDGWAITTVSDGAGSKPLSRIGAKVSCEAALASIKSELSELRGKEPDIANSLSKPFDDPDFTAACSKLAVIVQNSIGTAFSAVEGAYIVRSDNPDFEEAIGRKPELKDYSGTLLASVAIPVAGGETFIAAIQLGDGMIASFNREADFGSALRILGNADSGSFAGETEFLTSEQLRTPDSLMSRTKIQRGKVSSLMLMTDGVADDYYPNNPELLRLYIDLMLNGIVDIPAKEEAAKLNGVSDSAKDEAVPKPVSYPWVNNSGVTYSLQYAKNVMSETGTDLKKLWEDRFGDTVRKASLQSFDISNGSGREERLSVWLDNYVERGSFDDRTLLIVNIL